MRGLLVPMLAFLFVMVAIPLGYAVWLSFTDFRFGSPTAFVGLGNYRTMLSDPAFWSGLRVTFVLYLLSLGMQLVLGCYLGMLLNRLRFARRFLQTVLMSPFLLPPVVIGMMWLVILDPSLGAANWILHVVGLPPSEWLASPVLVLPVLAVLDTWQWTPFVALLVLGGLQTMPDGVDEAAAIDGAQGFSMLRYITLPLLLPTLFTALVLRSVDLLRFFDLIYITTQGGPGIASQTLNIYAFRRGLEFFDMGYASALMITLARDGHPVRGAGAVAAAAGRRMVRPGLGTTAAGRVLRMGEVAAVCAIVLIPIAWMIASSLKHSFEVTRYPPVLLFTPTLDNFRRLFTDVMFLQYAANSLIVAGGSTALGLLLAVPAAFAISWHRSSWPATLALFTRMAPGTLFVLPWFILFTQTGLIGTHAGLILAHTVVTMPLILWVLMPHFDSVPRSIFESALIDGCRQLGCLWRVAVPLVVPGLTVAAILAFISSWNFFLFALVLGSIDTKTLIVLSFNFVGEGSTDWGRLMAAAVIISAPPILMIFVAARGLVGGLTSGAVKG